ncbi:MAG: cyclic nucleotide-binding domain-containing protein [Desulfobacteraceae bacterium]|nr:cyclic nucleotide-binding domain-containing protein [Desulfobacteraceae bacterium]
MHHLDSGKIKQLQIFADLLPEEWSQVYPLLDHIRVIEGEQLIREGDRARSLFIILRGHFMIHYRDGKAFTLNKKGDIIGWSAVISPFQYTANVTALTDGDVLCIPSENFVELIQGNTALGTKLIRKINEFINSRPHTGML